MAYLNYLTKQLDNNIKVHIPQRYNRPLQLMDEDRERDKIDAIVDEITESNRQIRNFSGNTTDKEYRILEEQITQQLTRLDGIETTDRQDLKEYRKQAINYANHNEKTLEHNAHPQMPKTGKRKEETTYQPYIQGENAQQDKLNQVIHELETLTLKVEKFKGAVNDKAYNRLDNKLRDLKLLLFSMDVNGRDDLRDKRKDFMALINMYVEQLQEKATPAASTSTAPKNQPNTSNQEGASPHNITLETTTPQKSIRTRKSKKKGVNFETNQETENEDPPTEDEEGNVTTPPNTRNQEEQSQDTIQPTTPQKPIRSRQSNRASDSSDIIETETEITWPNKLIHFNPVDQERERRQTIHRTKPNTIPKGTQIHPQTKNPMTIKGEGNTTICFEPRRNPTSNHKGK